MEIRARASRYDDRGNAVIVIQLPDPFDKRCDRLHIPVDDSLHQLIADHEVRGAGVFVNEQKGCARLYALHHVCRLGSTAAGVLCAEADGIFPVRQVIDKHGNVCLLDAPSILGADLHRRVVRDHIFPSVACDVVVHSQFKRFQKR